MFASMLNPGCCGCDDSPSGSCDHPVYLPPVCAAGQVPADPTGPHPGWPDPYKVKSYSVGGQSKPAPSNVVTLDPAQKNSVTITGTNPNLVYAADVATDYDYQACDGSTLSPKVPDITAANFTLSFAVTGGILFSGGDGTSPSAAAPCPKGACNGSCGPGYPNTYAWTLQVGGLSLSGGGANASGGVFIQKVTLPPQDATGVFTWTWQAGSSAKYIQTSRPLPNDVTYTTHFCVTFCWGPGQYGQARQQAYAYDGAAPGGTNCPAGGYGGPAMLAMAPGPTRQLARSPRLAARIHANSFTGYGQHSVELMRVVERILGRVEVEPIDVDPDETMLPLDPWLRARLLDGRRPGPKFVSRTIKDLTDYDCRDNVVLTMWETDWLLPAWVAALNLARCVVVPCRWNADFFRSNGVTAPVRVVPMGIDPAVFHPGAPAPDRPFVVGAAGRLVPGADRKGLDAVVRAFLRAFPDDPDVRLDLKVWDDARPEGLPADPRIRLVAESLTAEGLAGWYRSLSVFASGAKSGGWELQPHQAMACGVPTAAAIVAGHAAYMTRLTTYPVEYDEAPVAADNPVYGGLGNWFPPREESLAAMLRLARDDPGRRRLMGRSAARRALDFTWDRAGRELAEILVEFGVARRPAAVDPVQVAVDTCPFASGSCGCAGAAPRHCSRAGRPDRVMQRDPAAAIDCYRCQFAELGASPGALRPIPSL